MVQAAVREERKLLTNLMDSNDVLNQINFPVALEDVRTTINGKDIIIPNRKAIIRTDTEQYISTVSNVYKMVTHTQALEPAVEALAQEDYKFSRVALHKHGAKLILEAVAPSQAIRVMGEEHYPRILLVNSYDGSNQVKLLVGLFRVVCMNGMIAGSPGQRSYFATRHTGNAIKKVEMWREELAQTDWLSEYQARLEKLDKKVDEAYAREVIKKVFGITTKGNDSGKVEIALQNALHGDGQNGTLTKWAILNGITQTLRDYEAGSSELQLARRMLEANKKIMKTQQLLLSGK